MGWIGSYGGSDRAAYEGWETAGSIVNTAATELGLYVNSADFDDTTNPYVSTDPSVMLLCRLLTTCGRELVTKRDWAHLTFQNGIITEAGVTRYKLLSYVRSIIPQTAWNTTTRLPMIGPLSEQQAQAILARQIGVTLNQMFQVKRPYIELLASPPDGQFITYLYKSSRWLVSLPDTDIYTDVEGDIDAAGSGTEGDNIGGMLVLFDSLMVTAMLKMKFLQAKGFDATEAERAFKSIYDNVVGELTDVVPVLDLSQSPVLDPLLGPQNFPFTGFGG